MAELTALEDRRGFIVELASAKNLALSPDALVLLEKAQTDEIQKTLEQLAEQNLFIVNASDVETKLLRTKLSPQETEIRPRTGFLPLAKEYNSTFRERGDLHVTADVTCEGTINDYIAMFSDRFDALSAILKNRQGFLPRPIGKLSENAGKQQVDFIGMAMEKWVTKNGHLAFRFEDQESQCIALVLKDNAELLPKAQQVALDEVVGIKGQKGFGELIIIKEIIQPDLPLQAPKTISDPLSIAVVSDIHVGSKLFLETEFSRFIEWINGKRGNAQEREKAGRVKYLYVCGDNVDGIGVYPDQEKNLLITDIFEQYRVLEDWLLKIPDYIQVAIIPGQHDAVRWADPQPGISKEFLPRLHALSNYHLLPSPGWSQIEGLNVVQYHGAALHELYGIAEGLSMEKPELAMMEILKRRSFLVGYGNKQPYAPQKKDYSVIRETPDFYFGGDMHHYGHAEYRGCTVLNASCFQSQTDYEQKLGHVPTPGLVAYIDLQTRRIETKNMLEEAGGM